MADVAEATIFPPCVGKATLVPLSEAFHGKQSERRLRRVVIPGISQNHGGSSSIPMSTTKHRKTGPGDPPRDDLEDNPGIGASRGVYAGKGDPTLIEGESTFEGDVENDTNPQGGVDPGHIGRTNK